MWGEYVSAWLTDTHQPRWQIPPPPPPGPYLSAALTNTHPLGTFLWGYGSVVTPIDRGVLPSTT